MGRIISEKIKLFDCITEDVKKVLLVCSHGMGDVLSFRSVFRAIKDRWPHIHFDIGLNRSMGYQKIIPEAIFISRLEDVANEYDIVFIIKYHMEDFGNPNLTKSEKCCLNEIGIPPVSDHIKINSPPLVSVHFNSTCMPNQLGCPENIAKSIWDDIIDSGCCPIETHFIHKFHNPDNEKFKFIDMNCRGFNPSINSLSSIIGSSFAFVGVVSGNLHLALSILPPEKIFILKNRIQVGHVTKLPISNCSIDKYNGEVKTWLKNLLK